MNCSSSSVFNMLLWYRQNAGKGLDHLITLYKGGDSVPKGNMIAKFGERRMDSLLSISASAPEDSGTYFCAGTTQCDTSTCNLHSNLQLRPSHYAVSLCSCIGKTIWSWEYNLCFLPFCCRKVGYIQDFIFQGLYLFKYHMLKSFLMCIIVVSSKKWVFSLYTCVLSFETTPNYTQSLPLDLFSRITTGRHRGPNWDIGEQIRVGRKQDKQPKLLYYHSGLHAKIFIVWWDYKNTKKCKYIKLYYLGGTMPSKLKKYMCKNIYK